jgi:hypothetical protein
MKRFILLSLFALVISFTETNAQAVTRDYLYENSTVGQDSARGFRVYPNPNDGDMMLEVYKNIPALVRLDIYDSYGSLVHTRVLNEFNADGTIYINLRGILKPGHYLLMFNSNDKMVQTEKVLIIPQE